MKEFRKFKKLIKKHGFHQTSTGNHSKFQHEDGTLITVTRSLKCAREQLKVSLRDIKKQRTIEN